MRSRRAPTRPQRRSSSARRSGGRRCRRPRRSLRESAGRAGRDRSARRRRLRPLSRNLRRTESRWLARSLFRMQCPASHLRRTLRRDHHALPEVVSRTRKHASFRRALSEPWKPAAAARRDRRRGKPQLRHLSAACGRSVTCRGFLRPRCGSRLSRARAVSRRSSTAGFHGSLQSDGGSACSRYRRSRGRPSPVMQSQSGSRSAAL